MVDRVSTVGLERRVDLSERISSDVRFFRMERACRACSVLKKDDSEALARRERFKERMCRCKM